MEFICTYVRTTWQQCKIFDAPAALLNETSSGNQCKGDWVGKVLGEAVPKGSFLSLRGWAISQFVTLPTGLSRSHWPGIIRGTVSRCNA
jgi:hypothetical protein